MADKLKILIVGGGIAGMSCAISLSTAGHDIQLIDLDKEWRAYGTGITIQPATFRAFRQLGVAAEVLAAGFAAKGVRLRTADGSVIDEVKVDSLEPGLPGGGGIMRPVLHSILSRKTVEKGVDVRLGVTIESLTEERYGVRVRFTGGRTDLFDLVIGADGVHSTMRGMVFPTAPRPKFTGQGAFRTLAPRPADLDMIEVYFGDRFKPGVTPVSADQLYMFTLSPEPTAVHLDSQQQITRLREGLAGFGGLIGSIRDTLGPETASVYRPLEALILPKPWHKGRILLVGDAVHATTPQLASGACCAIEDGLLIAEYLDMPGTLEEALCAFTERRFDRCRDVVVSSMRIGELELARAPANEIAQVYASAMMRLAERA